MFLVSDYKIIIFLHTIYTMLFQLQNGKCQNFNVYETRYIIGHKAKRTVTQLYYITFPGYISTILT